MLIKKVGTERYGNNAPTSNSEYQIRTTVLGGSVISDLGAGGYKQKTYIHAAGSVIGNDAGVWNHKDPAMTPIRSTDSSGNLITAAEGDKNGKLEFDPQGNNVGFTDWWALSTQGTPDPTSGVEFPPFETIRNGQLVRYNADGIDVPPSFFFELSQFTFRGMFGLLENISRVKIGETWRTKGHRERS